MRRTSPLLLPPCYNVIVGRLDTGRSLLQSKFIIPCLIYLNNNSRTFCVSASLTGSISKQELKGVMKKLGQNPTDDDIEAMIKSVDDNGDGEIDFDEFLVLMSAKKKNNNDPDKELKDAFKVFDADGSGTISRSELKKLMKSLGQKLSDAELDAMMDEVDTDKSGEIDFDEFKAMMSS
jgi:calmodulin